MTALPPLADGEAVVFDHIPSLKSFKRAALFLIAVSMLPTIAFAFVFADSFWVIVPLFVTCVLLMQERFTMGRHRAWITNKRVILQGGDVPLGDIETVKAKSVYVQVRHTGHGKSVPLYYPENGPALAQAINAARQGEA